MEVHWSYEILKTRLSRISWQFTLPDCSGGVKEAHVIKKKFEEVRTLD